MKISRQGSSRNDGTRTIALEPLKVGWDKDTESVSLSCTGVRDFNTEANHDYVLQLSLTELGTILEHLTEKLPPEGTQSVQSGLASKLRAIIRLGLICVGGKTLLEE